MVTIYDTESSRLFTSLNEHADTVKCVEWSKSDPRILYSGGRDEDILLWDLRTRRLAYRMQRDKPKSAKKGGKQEGRRSVTAIVQHDRAPWQLISSCADNGYSVSSQANLTMDTDYGFPYRRLLAWDARYSTYSSGNTTRMGEDPTTAQGSIRPRGMTSIVKGLGRTNDMIFGLAFNSQLHVYDISTLNVLHWDYGDNKTRRMMRCMSYWVKLGIHPDGDQLASGDRNGKACMWDTGRVKEECASVISNLTGHDGEVGAVDLDRDKLVTCGDDGIVRIWRKQIDN